MKRKVFRFCCIIGLLAAAVNLHPSFAGEQEELISLVEGLLTEKDKDLRALGLEQVRTAAKSEAATKTKATQRFAALLPKLAPEAQASLLAALADRGDPAARPAVVELLASSNDKAVRLAAIAALGPLGKPVDVPQLVKLLGGAVKAEQAAARTSLAQMPGADVAPAIVEELRTAKGALRVMLIEVLLARRAKEAIPVLLTASVESDPAVRAAAMTALGQLADGEHIAAMIPGVLKAEPGSERTAAERAIAQAAGRIEEPARRAEPLLAALDKRPAGERAILLSAVGRIGGPAALAAVEAAIADPSAATHDAGVRALCNWPDASTAQRLIQLATNDVHPEHRTLALKALIRVAPLPDMRPDDERLALTKKVMTMCTTDDDRKTVLERVRAIRTIEALRFVAPYMDQPTFAQTACETVVELAHHRTLREPNKAEFHQALDKVVAISKDPVVVERAQRYKRNETWVRPKPAGP